MNRFEIEVRRETRHLRFSTRYLKNIARKILRTLGLRTCSLCVYFVNDRKIVQLNRKYLYHRYATDVMAFPGLDDPRMAKRLKRRFCLGDIVISVETVKINAARFQTKMLYELVYCLCHGILHLLGHQDKSLRDAGRMHLKQKQIMRKIGIQKRYGHPEN